MRAIHKEREPHEQPQQRRTNVSTDESFRDRDTVNQFGRGSSGPDAFFRWAEGAGIPVEEIKRQMRET